MKKFTIILLVFFILMSNFCFATKSTEIKNIYLKDTIKVIAFKTISSSALSSPLYTFDLKKMETLGIKNLTELVEYCPGVVIKDYGGLAGTKTISIHGSTSSQSLVMIEDIPVFQSQSGSFNLNSFSLDMFDNIEVTTAGSSAINGTNAIAGTMNLKVFERIDNKLTTKLSYGSQNQIDASIQKNFTNFSNFSLKTNISYTHSDGDYPYSTSIYGKETKNYRSNAEYEHFDASVFSNLLFSEHNMLLGALFQSTSKSVPGAVIQGITETSDAQYKEYQFTVLCKILSPQTRDFYGKSIYKWFGNANVSIYNNEYIDPSGSLGFGTFEEFHGWDLFASGGIQFEPYYYNLCVTFGFTCNSLNGDTLANTENNRAFRSVFFASASINKGYRVWDNSSLGFDFVFRLDKADSIFNNIIPSVMTGITLNIIDLDLLLKLYFSTNFRFPSFNEMYYLNYGSKDLMPEYSDNYNVSAIYNHFKNLSLQINGFVIQTKDQIVAIPVTPITYKATNFEKVFTYGADFQFKANDIVHGLDLSLSYTRQLSRDFSRESITFKKQVPNIPEEVFISTLSYKYGNMTLSSTAIYESFSYSLAENTVESVIPSHLVVNLNLMYNFCLGKFSTSFGVNNLFDVNYCIIKNYPMPGRHFNLGVRIVI